MNPKITKMRNDLDKTVDSVKSLMEDLYYFLNGTTIKPQPTMRSSTVKNNVGKVEPQVTKPQKDKILEAGAEQKREEKEEDLRRKKNLNKHKVPKGQSWDSKERYNEDMSLTQQISSSIEIEPIRVKNCTRLGKTPDQENRARPRPLRITLDSPEDTELLMKNLTKLNFAEDEIRQLRVTPDRSMKERDRF